MDSPPNLINSGKRPFEDFDSPSNSPKKINRSLTLTMEDPRTQIFNDPVHGFIEFHPLLVKIINTPQFQRLKDIKQLGVCYWVFPGASHNRFEHCLGTAYLCGKMIDTLLELHRDEIEITENESLCVRIAGLCHDLGHGPFSHFFDKIYIPRAKPGSKWKHEDASCALFNSMIKNNPGLNEAFESYGLLKEERAFIKELIHGKDPQTDTVERTCGLSGKPKWFLYEIVSNKRNGIDCDKFDYFARDCLNVGVNSNFDCRRYFQNVRIILVNEQLQICVREKEVFNLYELFHTRWSLHHRVYQHKTQAVIEHLLAEALLKVDQRLRISGSISDMNRYWKLTDSIIYDILRHDSEDSNDKDLRNESDDSDDKDLRNESDDSDDKDLRNESDDFDVKEAQALLLTIQRRELYKFCGQTRQLDSMETCPSESEIAKQMELCSNGSLNEDQVFVSIVDIHFGMKHRDPIDSVVFFNKSNVPLTLPKELVSHLGPQKFHERYIRVYAKSRDIDDTETVRRCFEAWCRNNEYPVPHVLEGDPISGYFTPVDSATVTAPTPTPTPTPTFNANANEQDHSTEP